MNKYELCTLRPSDSTGSDTPDRPVNEAKRQLRLELVDLHIDTAEKHMAAREIETAIEHAGYAGELLNGGRE